MRCFGEAERRAGENIFAATDELAFLERVFLEHDAGETILAGAMIPEHVDEIFFPTVVVKQRGVEAAAVHVNRIAPLAIDRRARDEVVVEIAERRAARAADGRA